jgi:hypothetical protein
MIVEELEKRLLEAEKIYESYEEIEWFDPPYKTKKEFLKHQTICSYPNLTANTDGKTIFFKLKRRMESSVFTQRSRVLKEIGKEHGCLIEAQNLKAENYSPFDIHEYLEYSENPSWCTFHKCPKCDNYLCGHPETASLAAGDCEGFWIDREYERREELAGTILKKLYGIDSDGSRICDEKW